MKNIEQDRLKDIFGKMKVESPSMRFEKQLMQRVHIEKKLIEKKQRYLSLLSIVLGTLVLIAIPVVVFTLFEYSVPDIFQPFDVNIISLLASIKFDYLMISVAVICLLLLMGDTLIRKHLRKREEN